MPECETKYYGRLAYEEDSVFEFPTGLIGFENETRFLPVEPAGASPIVLLQSLATPLLCFVALPVLVVDPAYRIAALPEDLRAAGLPPGVEPVIGTDVLCLVLITIQEHQATTANLLAPLLVNLKTRQGVQAISTDPAHTHQHPFLEPAEAVTC